MVLQNGDDLVRQLIGIDVCLEAVLPVLGEGRIHHANEPVAQLEHDFADKLCRCATVVPVGRDPFVSPGYGWEMTAHVSHRIALKGFPVTGDHAFKPSRSRTRR